VYPPRVDPSRITREGSFSAKDGSTFRDRVPHSAHRPIVDRGGRSPGTKRGASADRGTRLQAVRLRVGALPETTEGGDASPTQIGVCEREADPDPISVVGDLRKFRDRSLIRKRSAAVHAGPGNVAESRTDHRTVLVGGPAGRSAWDADGLTPRDMASSKPGRPGRSLDPVP